MAGNGQITSEKDRLNCILDNKWFSLEVRGRAIDEE